MIHCNYNGNFMLIPVNQILILQVIDNEKGGFTPKTHPCCWKSLGSFLFE